jgi:hypothetical protein
MLVKGSENSNAPVKSQDAAVASSSLSVAITQCRSKWEDHQRNGYERTMTIYRY